METNLSRRHLIASLGALATAGISARAAGAGLLDSLGLTKLLGNASDTALNKLGETDGFYRDLAVRIALPGVTGKLARRALRFGDKLGLTTALTKSLNDAASLAALEAKPVFRAAISQIKLKDVPGIATNKDGASQYLLRSAGPDLELKVKPLIAAALTKVGAYKQIAKINQGGGLLAALGLSEERVTDSVAKQAMNGIFSYIGAEEARLRANPFGIL